MPLLLKRMVRVCHEERKWVAEGSRCLLERDSVLSEVGLSLSRIATKIISF
jgi:hypothetical protein